VPFLGAATKPSRTNGLKGIYSMKECHGCIGHTPCIPSNTPVCALYQVSGIVNARVFRHGRQKIIFLLFSDILVNELTLFI